LKFLCISGEGQLPKFLTTVNLDFLRNSTETNFPFTFFQ
jgi:hypothetical protein